MEEEQAALQSYGERFVVCKNRPENDEHWDSEVRGFHRPELQRAGGSWVEWSCWGGLTQIHRRIRCWSWMIDMEMLGVSV